MKLKDNTTLSIAAAVSDVVEGRVKKEDEFKPHMMYDPETGKGYKAEKPEDHERMKKLGYTHEKPEVDEVAEPKAKGEKDFKAKHAVKKSGAKEDGTVVKEEDEEDEDEVEEALQPVTKIRFDYKDTMPKSPKPSDVGGLKQDWKSEKMSVQSAVKSLGGLVTDSEAPSKSNKFVGTISIGTRGDASKLSNAAIQKAVKGKGAEIQSNQFESVVDVEEAKSKFPKALLKKATDLALKMGGNMTGAVKKIEKMKKGLSDDPEVKAALQLANEEVTEEIVAEAHAMNEAKSKMAEDKERYQKFFKSALKKFGVTSPGELEGEKKKEFFNYVDKNYEADNEED